MKKVYTFEKVKTRRSKHRCPHCGSHWYQVWRQIDPIDRHEPMYHSECLRCRAETDDFYREDSAPTEWETLAMEGQKK